MMWGWGGGPFWMGGLFMWFVPLLIIGLVIWAFAGSRRQFGPIVHGGQEALEVLKMRLARGEITEEEYRRLRDAIK